VRLVRRIARQAPLAPFIAAEIAPGIDVDDDAALDAYARATVVTAHHPCGTCRMGPDGDPGAVLDAELRVRGIDGLRVIDASSMPSIVGGNINATVVALAERGAALVADASSARGEPTARFASPRLSPTMTARP
jgi:choline dehydrogenase-like flavoprotein